MATLQPNLNPMDFSIWNILETNACTRSHTSVESLKRSLCSEWVKIPDDNPAVEAVPGRLRAVISKKGSYIE